MWYAVAEEMDAGDNAWDNVGLASYGRSPQEAAGASIFNIKKCFDDVPLPHIKDIIINNDPIIMPKGIK